MYFNSFKYSDACYMYMYMKPSNSRCSVLKDKSKIYLIIFIIAEKLKIAYS